MRQIATTVAWCLRPDGGLYYLRWCKVSMQVLWCLKHRRRISAECAYSSTLVRFQENPIQIISRQLFVYEFSLQKRFSEDWNLLQEATGACAARAQNATAILNALETQPMGCRQQSHRHPSFGASAGNRPSFRSSSPQQRCNRLHIQSLVVCDQTEVCSTCGGAEIVKPNVTWAIASV